jgi:hypothetical protein
MRSLLLLFTFFFVTSLYATLHNIYLISCEGELEKIEKTLEAKDLERFKDLKSYFGDLNKIRVLLENGISKRIFMQVFTNEIFKKASYIVAKPNDGQEEVAKDLESELEHLGGCSESCPTMSLVFSILGNIFQELKAQRDTNIEKYAKILTPAELILFLLKLLKEEFEKYSMEGSDAEEQKQLKSFMEVVDGVLSETPKKPKDKPSETNKTDDKTKATDSKNTDGKKSSNETDSKTTDSKSTDGKKSNQNSINDPQDNFTRNMKIFGAILVILAVLSVIAFFVFKKLKQ